MAHVKAEKKTIVWTNCHGDEVKSREVGRSLRAYPIANVDTQTANELATEQGERFVHENMAFSFSEPDPHSPIYERRRAAKVLAVSSLYHTVVDLHNVREKGGNFAQINPDRLITPDILNFIGHIGIQHVLVAKRGLYAEVDNGVLIEMSADFDTELLRDGLDRITNTPASLAPRSVESFTWLDHAGGLSAAHVAQEGTDWLSKLEKFDEVPHLSAEQKVFVMSWAQTPNIQGYHGELASPLLTPPTLRQY